MKFKEFYKITIDQIDAEIEKDNKVNFNKTPLFESPMFHEAEYFDKLNDIRTNHPFALERIQDSNLIETVVIDGTQYELYRKLHEGYTWDFFVSGQQGHELMYAFIRYVPSNNIMKIRGLWQIEFVVGLVRGVISNYYSNQYSVLESDSIANSKGKKFFQNLAKDYLQQGKKVVVSMKGNEIPYRLEDAESYWTRSFSTQSVEKIIIYNF